MWIGLGDVVLRITGRITENAFEIAHQLSYKAGELPEKCDSEEKY